MDQNYGSQSSRRLITKSVNDAATVMAEKPAGTKTLFALIMTARVRQIRTARDMATLSMVLRRD